MFRIFGSIKKVIHAIELNYSINQTIKELSRLSDRELNDIGITRGMIRSVAMEANNAKMA